MKNENIELNNFISKSKRILLLTHKGPDLDAFCSMILISKILKNYYPEKEVIMQAKQLPSLNLPGMQEIQVVEEINSHGFDLIVITDAGDINMCLEKSLDQVDYENTPLIFIDHHKTRLEHTENILLINNGSSSATEEVYLIFQDILGKDFQIDNEMAELIQYGIVFDTERFLYESSTSSSFRVFADAKDVSSVDLEEYTYKSSKFPLEITPVVIEYLKTLTVVKDMAYITISKDTMTKFNFTKQAVNKAQSFLRDRYIKYIQGVHWGFTIRPSFKTEDHWYVSFRSLKGSQDVSIIAEELGGGGHMYSAAVPMKANSSEEVLERVLTVVKKYL
ncbi:MAG: bifunctional oligoribonuclease/PAP phosphatase NrnA [Candidatus Dojkabacteria bacterium]